MIDDIAINLWYSWNFVSMEDIKRKCNPLLVDLSKFTPINKILNGVVILVYNQVCCQTCLKFNYVGLRKI